MISMHQHVKVTPVKTLDSPPPGRKGGLLYSPTSGLSASASKLNKAFGPGFAVIGAGLLATLVQPRVRARA